jgi:3-methylcrotonyl-CoA carboxylase alpha subunit
MVQVLATGVFEVQVDETRHKVTYKSGSWWVDDTKVPARTAQTGQELTVFWGNGYRFEVVDPLDREDAGADGGNLISAPMPGLVKAIFATPGQPVARGDRLAVLEAMKMEHALLAPRDGTISEVMVSEGAQVEDGSALIVLADEEEHAP